MAVSVTEEFDIDATPEQVMAALVAVDRIPEWSSAHKSVDVESSYEDGRPRTVRMTLSILGISDTQVSEYEWDGDTSVRWTLVESEMQKAQDGEYVLTPSAKGTEVKVTMTVDPKIPLPGFLLKKGQKQAISIVRKGLTQFVAEHFV